MHPFPNCGKNFPGFPSGGFGTFVEKGRLRLFLQTPSEMEAMRDTLDIRADEYDILSMVSKSAG
jgi:hypothetical protein